MHRSKSVGLLRIGGALVAGILMAAVAGCGSAVEGRAVRVPTDTSGLTVGNYPTEPIEYGTAGTEKAGRIREAHRLGDFVVIPFEIDPAFSRHIGPVEPVVLDRRDMESLVVNDTFDEVAKDLVTGWVHNWSTGDGDTPETRQMAVAVLVFPDAETAKTVAAGLEHDDYTFNIDNRPAPFGRYPETRAHWRPGTASLGSWTSHDRYVVFVKYTDNANRADLPTMVGSTEALLDAQLPLLDEFRPTPRDQLASLPLDPDGLLARTHPKSQEIAAATGPTSVFKGRGALHALSGINSLDFLDAGRVTDIALGEGIVIRSATAAGAQVLWDRFRPRGTDPASGTPIDTPHGLGENVACSAVGAAPATPTLLCAFQVDRYFAQIDGLQIQDLHQKTSAQYALLTSG
ncbi:DUF7373 family lipoprotein [Nocardia sp. NPDC003345]